MDRMETARRETEENQVAVIGGGAAGLCAAIFAARAGAEVVLLETRSVPGAKIRVSGGGRCNVLPSEVSLENFHTSGSRNALRNILLSWPLEEVTRFFRQDLGLEMYVEAGTGKVFPTSNQSREVVTRLLRECERVGVRLVGDSRVARLQRSPGQGGPFRLKVGDGVREAAAVVLATGGLSMPRTGSDGHGLRLAATLGHGCVSLHPALVPLRSDAAEWTELAGIALRVTLSASQHGTVLEERTGDLLFTHRGFSGPVILDLSRHFTQTGADLLVRWTERDEERWRAAFAAGGAQPVLGVVAGQLPRRLARLLLGRAGVPEDRRCSELRRDERDRLCVQLVRCSLPLSGDEGYAKAEVTAGGVPLAEVHTRTLESRHAPGLFLCGEILDVVAHIGGYNFLWAWVSGRRAGMAAAAHAATRHPQG